MGGESKKIKTQTPTKWQSPNPPTTPPPLNDWERKRGSISDEMWSIYLRSADEMGEVHDEVRCKGEKRNEAGCLLDTEVHTRMKDERHGGGRRGERRKSSSTIFTRGEKSESLRQITAKITNLALIPGPLPGPEAYRQDVMCRAAVS